MNNLDEFTYNPEEWVRCGAAGNVEIHLHKKELDAMDAALDKLNGVKMQAFFIDILEEEQPHE